MTLPDGWLIKPLAAIAQVVMGQSPDSKYYSEEEVGLPFLQGCAEFQGRHPKHAIYCSHSKKIGSAGSILLSVRAPVGRLNIANRDYVIGRGLAALKGTRVTQDFLEHFLVFQEPRFRLASQGSTFEAINSSELKQWRILHPKDKAEQAKIAAVLSAMHRAIEETEALIAKQQRIKTGLMQDLLTRGIDEHGNLRSEQTHEFKDSPLGRIPAGWAVATLNQLTPTDAPIGYGIVQPGAYDPSGVRVAGIYTISSDFEKWHMSSSAIEAAYQRSRIRPGDVLLSIKGSTGRVGVVPPSIQGNISREIARIRPTAALNPHFIRFQLLSNSYQRYLLNAEVGTTRAELSIKVLRELSVAVPPRAEQNKIALRLASAERHLNATHLWLKKLRRVKTGHMQELLTGKRRVTPLLEQCEAVTT